ncbi:hypothetical protein EAG_10040 [Camponotus floridanus]|uniref:Uncharacterized protein n=1 Tax=Camponotus floridanus TaxID=104421 RepID=E2AV57_CAMFO|nr:hypothetical protein EAG_10040 [Camponotus floridanus]
MLSEKRRSTRRVAARIERGQLYRGGKPPELEYDSGAPEEGGHTNERRSTGMLFDVDSVVFSGFKPAKSRSKVSNALPRNKNIFNHNTRRAFGKRYVFCLSHGPYRIGLAYQLRYHYRLELFSVVRPLPVTGSAVSTIVDDKFCNVATMDLTMKRSNANGTFCQSSSTIISRCEAISFEASHRVNANPKQEPVIGCFRHIVKWEERKTKDKKRRRETRKRLERVLVSNDSRNIGAEVTSAGVAIGMLINERFAADLAKADAIAENISSLMASSRARENYTLVALVSASCFYTPTCTSAFNRKRATSAEKEIAALKEQLAATNDSNSKTEGHQLSQPPQGSDQQQVHDASNPRRTPNSNLEQELQAKDKENTSYPPLLEAFFSPGSGQEEPKW